MNTFEYPVRNLAEHQRFSDEKQSEFIDLNRLIAMARRQFFLVTCFVIAWFVLGLVILATTPPQYTAVAKVLIDDRLSQIVEEASPAPQRVRNDAALLSEIEVIRSARIADAVGQALNLEENQVFLRPPSSMLGQIIGTTRGFVRALLPGGSSSRDDSSNASAAEIAVARSAAMKEYVRTILQSNVMVERAGRSYAISIAFRSHDSQLAAEITNAYAEAYIADQLEANFDATQQATEWMQTRLQELQVSSQLASQQTEDFRSRNGLSSTRGLLITEQQLSELNSQLALARAETARAEARFQQFRQVLDTDTQGLSSFSLISSEEYGNAALVELKTRLDAIDQREQEIRLNFGEDHPQAVLLQAEQREIVRQITTELNNLSASLRSEFEISKARENALEESVSMATGRNSEASQAQIALRGLEQRSEAVNSLYQTFLSRYEEVSQQQSFPVSAVRIISDATVPRSKSSPRTIPVLGMMIVLGGLIGGMIGIVREYNERFFRTGSEVRDVLKLKFLGYAPKIEGKTASSGKEHGRRNMKAELADLRVAPTSRLEKSRMLAALANPTSMFTETLRNARIAADVVLQAKQHKVIGFVSILPGEGKSTIAANFAALLASHDSRVLIIDGDIRNPGLSRAMLSEPTDGLLKAVIENKTWRDVAKVIEGTKLCFVGNNLSGQFSHTSELLSSEGMQQFVAEAKETFDYIILDLPPIGPVVDAKAVSQIVDAYIMVTEWGKTPRLLVSSQLNAEAAISDKLLGVILNKVDLKSLPKYSTDGTSEKFLKEYNQYYGTGAQAV